MNYEKANNKISFGQIDLFKFIAALLVITIHTDPLSTYSECGNFILTRIIARLAVPFFFISSGYLFSINLSDNKVKNKEHLFQYIKKILNLYLITIIIYIPINLYNGYFNKNNSIIDILKDLIFNGTIYHLWYLPALILGMVIMYWMINKFEFNKTFVITIVLYIVGILGDSYYGIIKNISSFKSIYDNLFFIFDYTRNGLFFAPIFITLGYKLSSLYNKEKTDLELKKDLASFIFFLILFAVETTLLRIYNIPKHDSMTIFLIPTIYCLFKLCLQFKNIQMKNLRKMSLYIYILHPIMIVVARVIGKITKTSDLIINNSVINYIVVTLLSVFASIVLINIRQRKLVKIKYKKLI